MDEEEVKWIIGDEERIRHDALFYSQKPRDGFLSGEKARALFIRSKLPLPELSKIWKLADITRDSMLDSAEFAMAVHLIQSRLRGLEIPSSLPQSLLLQHLPYLKVPQMTLSEWEAYQNTFDWKDKHRTGYLDTQTACSVLSHSQLPSDILAKIWDLSDLDRDLQLSLTEFAIALHLVRFCKGGNRLNGSVDVMSLLPDEIPTEDPNTKRQRLVEVQISKRRLLSTKEKFCHEIAGALNDDRITERVRPELDKVETQLQSLEKEESELRKDLWHLQDKTKKGVYNPFDRSFLLKRRPSGKDLFKEKALINNQVEDIELNKHFTVNGSIEIQHPSSNSLDKTSVDDKEILNETPAHVVNDDRVISDSQKRVVGNNNHCEETVEEKPTFVNSEPNVIYHTCSDYAAIQLNEKQAVSEEEMQSGSTRTIDFNQQQEDGKPVRQKFKFEEYSQNGPTGNPISSSGSVTTEKTRDQEQNSLQNGDGVVHYALVNEDVEYRQAKPGISCANVGEVFRKLDSGDEETKFQGKDFSSVSAGLDKSSKDDEKISGQAAVSTNKGTVEPSQNKQDVMLEKLGEGDTKVLQTSLGSVNADEDSSSTIKKTDINEVVKSETTNNLAFDKPENKLPTHKGLFPRPISVVEDKKRESEERIRKRKIEEDLLRKARQDQREREEEQKKATLERKALFEKERQRLLHQMSLADQEDEVKRSPLSKTDAGKTVERELDQQRIREKRMQLEKDQIVEQEKREVEKTKLKYQHVEHQTPTDKSSNEEQRKTSVVKSKERQKPVEKRTATEKRKSFIELEIERQKAADEELRKETERRALERLHNQTSSSLQGQKIVKSPSAVESQSQNNSDYKDVVDSGVRVASDNKLESEESKTTKTLEEQERKREKEQQEKARKEFQLREAAELIRQKTIREEELRRKKEAELAEAEKCRREEQDRESRMAQEAKLRRTVFEAQKKFLEQRMKKEIEESEIQRLPRRRTSSSSSTASSERSDTLDEPRKLAVKLAKTDNEDSHEQPIKTSIKDRMATFQQKESTRPKTRKSFPGVDENVNGSWKTQEEVTMRSNAPRRDSKHNRTSFYAENQRAKEIKEQVERDPEARPKTEEDIYSKRAISFGDVLGRRKQFEQNSAKNQSSAAVKVKSGSPSSPRDEEDGGRIPAFRDERTGKDLEDQKKKDVPAELSKGKPSSSIQGDKIDNIRRNPLPNKMQVTKTDPKTSPSQGTGLHAKSHPPEQPRKKVGKSLIELEREEERRREEELAQAREEARRAMMSKEQKLEEERRRKQEEEAEQARKAQEEKEKRKRRTSAMAAMWEKMAQQ